ncbi:PAS domain S-box protein [candidate division KSB1 bacterium]|nr:PAS domain S-box protein [candidate division KSB1 bacterium]
MTDDIPLSVLYVEDDPDDVCLVQNLLSRSTVPVDFRHVATGFDAIELYEKLTFDCILVDLNLPDTNGLTLLRKIRAFDANLPLILLTGQNDDRLTLGTMKLGRVTYLRKDNIHKTDLAGIILHLVEELKRSKTVSRVNPVNTSGGSVSVAYQALVETMFDALVSIDNNGTILFFNHQLETLVECDVTNLPGQNVERLICRPSLKVFRKQQERVRRGLSVRYELSLIRCEQQVIPVIISQSPQFNNDAQLVGSQLVITDISYQKEAALKLIASEKRFRDITENLPDLILETDAAGKILFLNGAVSTILGYPVKEALRLQVHTMVYEPDQEKFQLFLATALDSKSSVDAVIRFKHRDGQIVYLEIKGFPARQSKKSNVKYRWIARDVTERQKAQEQLIQTSKLASLGMLAAGIAHELNNPLTVIIGQAQLLQMKFKEHEFFDGVKPILDAGFRAKKIVENVLEFSHQHRSQHDQIDINKTLHSTITLLGKHLSINNIKLIEHYSDDLPYISGDKGQLQQLFLNIIQNACDSLIATNKAGHIEIETHNMTTDTIQITIRDDGPGMPEKIRKRVFDPFFTTKPPGQGTGLGLSICQNIVQKHDGRIEVSSRQGHGTSFVIELPVHRIDTSMFNNIQNEQLEASSQFVCLLVDEDDKYQGLHKKLTGNPINSSCTIIRDISQAIDQMHAGQAEYLFIDIKKQRALRCALEQKNIEGWKERVIFVVDFSISASVSKRLNRESYRWIHADLSSDKLYEKIFIKAEVV